MAQQNNALSSILNAGQYLGTTVDENYCESFIEKVTGSQTRYPSAINAFTSQLQSGKATQGTQGIQPGDSIYFSPNAGNGGYGHVALYLGGNMMISATSDGVKVSDINQWTQGTGQQILGFAGNKGKSTLKDAISIAPQYQTAIQTTKQAKQLPLGASPQLQNPMGQMPQPQLGQLGQQPSGQQQQQQQPPPSAKIQMPQVQNPAGSSAPYPMGAMMSSMSGGAQGPGQSQGGRSPMMAPTMARGGYSPTSISQPTTIPRTTGTGSSNLSTNAAYQNYLAYLNQIAQSQQSIANQQAALQQSANTLPDVSNLQQTGITTPVTSTLPQLPSASTS